MNKGEKESELKHLRTLYKKSQEYDDPNERWTETDYKTMEDNLFKRIKTMENNLFKRMRANGESFSDPEEQRKLEGYILSKEWDEKLEEEIKKRYEELKEEYRKRMKGLSEKEKTKNKKKKEDNIPQKSRAYSEPVRLYAPKKQKQKKKYVSRFFRAFGNRIVSSPRDISDWFHDTFL